MTCDICGQRLTAQGTCLAELADIACGLDHATGIPYELLEDAVAIYNDETMYYLHAEITDFLSRV